MKHFWRIANINSKDGLWYNQSGEFTGLIHNKFSFCKNSNLEMPFDEELVGWLSAVETLDDLFIWFTEDDIKQLEAYGCHITHYLVPEEDVKYYERFEHWVIKQETAFPIAVYYLEELL
jgi:hypothetical protein